VLFSSGGSLAYYKVNEKIARVYMSQILQALRSLHSKLIIHRNVNMNSFYLTGIESPILAASEQIIPFKVMMSGLEFSTKNALG
jgi:serine/threonine protein kinase